MPIRFVPMCCTRHVIPRRGPKTGPKKRSENVDPIVGHAFERLWLYVFLEEDEIASFLEALQCDYKTAPRGYS